MKKIRIFFLSFAAALALLAAGCDTTETTDTDEQAAKEKTDQAYAEMENLFAASGDMTEKNFSNVEKLYMDAVAAAPNNATANFGAAFSHILNTFSDTAIKNSVKRWEDFSNSGPGMFELRIPTGSKDMALPTKVLSANIVKIIQTATSDPPTITEMQNLMRDRLLPRINYAIARLAIVEQDAAFELRISGKLQGSPGKSDVYLDLTEVYVMDAALHGMKSIVEQFLVFKFELSSYSNAALVAALQQNSNTFFVLATDGAAKAQSVKSSLIGAVGKMRAGVTFLKGETDDQDNDIIKKGGSISNSDIDSMLVYLNRLETALTGTYTVEVKDADSDGNDYLITVSLNNFFSNLPQNPKAAWLPAYTIDTNARGDIDFHFNANTYAEFTFPDPTFSGLFPGMQQETLKRLLYIDEEFSWRVYVSMNDNAGSLNMSSTMKMTVNGVTYTPKANHDDYYSPYWRSFEFYIPAGDGLSPQLTAVINGQDVPLQFSIAPVVRLRSSDQINADVTRAPQNISLNYNSSEPKYIGINLQQWGHYQIERSVNGGAFQSLGSYYTSYHTDMNIVGSTTYQYKALRMSTNDNWGYFAQRPNNYTNTASFTTP